MDSVIDYNIFFLLLIGTILIVYLVIRRVKDNKMKAAVILSAISIFVYSGIGISMPSVRNIYIYKYLIALFFFYLPFIMVERRKAIIKEQTSLDFFFEKNSKLLRSATMIYFIVILIPMFFPRFRLFDILTRGITLEGIYDIVNENAASSFMRLLSMLKLFLMPFFLANIMLLRIKRPHSSRPYILFLLDIILNILDICYISRSALVYDFFILFFMGFCIKDGEFFVTRRQIVTILIVAIASLPFMYAFTFIRLGSEVESVSYGQGLQYLLMAECTYPEYYDHILSSPILQQISPFSVVLWLIFLPIPSVLWPSKPTLANDVFTYSITGLHKTDVGYSSLLPSFLGESFMYFGEHFYWLYAFITGLIFALIIKYLSKHKYMFVFVLYLIMQLTAVGRVGPTVALPRFLNGTLLVFILDWFYIKKERKTS